MTAPHLTSDDTAIAAAQAGIRGNLEARARACFDAAIKCPSLGAVEAVSRALHALRHQWVAELERRGLDVPVEAPAADCQGEYPRAVTAGESDALRAAILASSKVVHGGCMANPAPMAAERGARPIAGSMIKSRLALAALLLLPLPAAAQTMPCAPFRALTATLKDAAGEQPVTEALGADGKLWVTFVARGGATWTLVSVDAQGRACMVMIGKGFGVSRPEPEGQPS